MTKRIQLTQGKIALVSDHRFDYLNQFNWYARRTGKRWYALRTESKTRRKILMHREIMSPSKEMGVDHRNGDGLDNQDENLRVCTTAQNLRNRGKNKNNTTGYKGVTTNESKTKYYAKIKIDRKIFRLGRHATAEAAARAYDEAAKELHGDFAWTNF